MYLLHYWNNFQSGVWFEFDDKNQLLSQKEITDLTNCPQIDAESFLVVLLPGRFVRMTQAIVPKMRSAERARALPFILEEGLASEPNQVAVIAGDTTENGALTAAVFEKEKFASKLAMIRDHGFKPDVVMPDYLALIWQEKTWTIFAFEETVLVRSGRQMGFAVDIANLSVILPMMLGKAAKNNELPETIICYQYNAVIDPSKLANLDIKVTFQDIPPHGVFDLSALRNSPALNLLQGTYRPKHKVSMQKRNWWIAASVFALWLFVLFGGQIAQWIYYSHKENQLSAAVLKTYQQIFPDANSVLEPRFRVNQLLDKLKKASEDGVFLRMLAITGKALNRYPMLTLQSANFENKQLTMQVMTNDMAALEKVRTDIQQNGFMVDQQMKKTDEKMLSVTLTVQEAS